MTCQHLLDVAGAPFSEVEASGMYQYGDFEDVAEPNTDPSTADVGYSDPAVDVGSSTPPEQPAQQLDTSAAPQLDTSAAQQQAQDATTAAAEEQPSQERPKSAGRRGRPKKGAMLNHVCCVFVGLFVGSLHYHACFGRLVGKLHHILK